MFWNRIKKVLLLLFVVLSLYKLHAEFIMVFFEQRFIPDNKALNSRDNGSVPKNNISRIIYPAPTVIHRPIDRLQTDHKCVKLKEWVNRKRVIFQEMFAKWITLTKQYNVSYVLTCGSLLGQFRNGDMIPWDRDADVWVNISDYETIKKMVTPRNFKQGADNLFHFLVQPDYQVEPPSKMRRWNCAGKLVPKIVDECSWGYGPMARLLKGNYYIDIFGLKELKDGRAYDHYKKKYVQTADVYPAKDCFYMDLLSKCPRNQKKVLEELYSSLHPPYNFCKHGRWVKQK